MPAGGTELGYVYFAATKLLGYSGYCRWVINPKITTVAGKAPSFWKAGAWRTVIGVCVGIIVGFSFWKIPWFTSRDNLSETLFFVFLLPVRIGEWLLLLRTTYVSYPLPGGTQGTIIAGGIVASFVLDAIGILAAFALPGGMWVC
jgi:hypothetical protein